MDLHQSPKTDRSCSLSLEGISHICVGMEVLLLAATCNEGSV